MNCLNCGAEMSDTAVKCDSCGANNLKIRFYAENETQYKTEQELVSAINSGEIKVSFRRADKVDISTVESKWWSVFGMIVATILSLVVIGSCIYFQNYWGLLAIPVLYAVCPVTRSKVGILFLAGAVVAVVMNASYGITIALICCFVGRLMYYYWMHKCDLISQRVILKYFDDFYAYWYNQRVALLKGGEVLMHSSFRKQN